MLSKIVFVVACMVMVSASDDGAVSQSVYNRKVHFFETIQTRVVSGQPAQRAQLPWHALIEIVGMSGMTRVCAGSLIASNWVLSEANALRGAQGYDIVLGARARRDRRHTRRASRAILHPGHQPGSPHFNVSLLPLDRAFTEYTDLVRPVQLTDANVALDFSGRHGWISGFGSSSESIKIS